VTALVFLVALGALAAAYSMNVRSSLNLRGSSGVRRSAFYAAEGGLNVGIARFANIFQGGGVPQGSDFQQSVTLADKTVDVELNEVPSCNPCSPTQIPQGEVFAGLNTIPYRYTIQSVSHVPPADSTAHVAGEFDIHNIPIFQFLAFTDSNLFIMPLPDMTLHGRLHTNGNLYIQPDSVLLIEDNPPSVANVQVTSAGGIYRGGFKYDSSWRCWGTASIDMLADLLPPLGNLDPKVMLCPGNQNPLPDGTLVGWNGTIKSNVRNIVTPDVGIVNRGTGEYWQRADLRIVLDLNSPMSAINFGATDLCPSGDNTTSPALYHFVVQNASGTVDMARTRALWRFMCEHRGALFYTDVPIAAPVPPANNVSAVSTPTAYAPPFADGNRVYRRVGEDTSGNGSLSSADRNRDICPTGPDAQAWWRPPDCPWPNSSPPSTSWYQDMDYRRGAFWNHREQQFMYLLNLNLRALIEWNEYNGDPLFPHDDVTDGGLVLFLTVDGPASNAASNNYGARIFDSADLDMRNRTFIPGTSDPTGINVVSDQAILIEGNLNKVDKFPLAVMADAIWILSQGWEVTQSGAANDAKSVYNLNTGVRDVPAQDSPGGTSAASFSNSSALTVNAALLFGIGPSTSDPTWYNGGIENFPRFLESWTNRTLNYRGSFVSLGEPQHKRNDWACGSGNACNGSGVYDPPTRNYDYDVDFDDVANLPPMTPKVVFVQQRIYTRVYD